MAFSTDLDLVDLIPDILDFGVTDFVAYHDEAYNDILRDIRSKWWSKTGYLGELDATLLTNSQWVKANAYLVLWKYALPQLTNWVDGDRFQNMIEFYKARYNDEMAAVYADGIEYDYNQDSTVSETEKGITIIGRLVR